MALDIGRIAYEAYAKGVDNISYHGQTLPKWEEIGKIGQDAWRRSACAVLDYIHDCEEEMKKDPAIIG